MLAEMLVYGVIDLNEAAQMLGYNNKNSVLRILRGEQNPPEAKTAKIKSLYGAETTAPKIATTKLNLLKELGLTPSRDEIREAEVKPLPRAEPAPEQSGGFDDELIAVLGHFVMAITPLLEEAVTGTTREQRNKLRQFVGNDGMFRLSKASSKLCSEKALEVMSKPADSQGEA